MRCKVRSFFLLLMLMFSVCCKADTLHVYFPTDEAFLNTATQKQLDKMIGKLKGEKDVLVIGYADERGDAYYNDMLSLRRAQTVAKYLQDHGIAGGEIKMTIGKGEVIRAENDVTKQTKDRRVDIVSGIQEVKRPEPAKPQPKPLLKPGPKPAVVSEQLDLEEVKEGQTLTLKNIQFLPGLAIVTEDSKPELDNLYEELKGNEVVIQVEGHICCINDEQDSDRSGLRLSVARAKVVYEYLREKGIAKNRMSYKGFSSTRPLVPERTQEDMARNRRVEIRVMKK